MTPDVELEPEQPETVVRAVAELLAPQPEADAWWQAGVDAALDTDSLRFPP